MRNWFCLYMIFNLTVMSGCGSNPDTKGPAPTSVISGVAAKAGTVYLRDASAPAKEVTAVTAADGSYTIDATGLQKPYMLKAVFKNNSTMYAFASEAGQVDINGWTTSIAQLAVAGLDLAALYLTIKAEVLLFVASAAATLAHSLGG